MTSIFNTPYGEMQQFVQNLHNGGFTYEDLRRVIKKPGLASGFHELVNPKLEFNPPPWWRAAEQQLERARQLWPDAVLPEPPVEFVPRTTSEVLLLHVPDTFDNLWDKVSTPAGCVKRRWEGVKSDQANLHLAPNKVEFTEPVWLAFDPEHGKGVRPDFFWRRINIAASEVFSAMIQFPDWSLAWRNGASAPSLAGYQLYSHNLATQDVPRLERWGVYYEGIEPGFELGACGASYIDDYRSSPSVREC